MISMGDIFDVKMVDDLGNEMSIGTLQSARLEKDYNKGIERIEFPRSFEVKMEDISINQGSLDSLLPKEYRLQMKNKLLNKLNNILHRTKKKRIKKKVMKRIIEIDHPIFHNELLVKSEDMKHDANKNMFSFEGRLNKN